MHHFRKIPEVKKLLIATLTDVVQLVAMVKCAFEEIGKSKLKASCQVLAFSTHQDSIERQYKGDGSIENASSTGKNKELGP